MSQHILNCDEPGWGFLLYSYLQAQAEVDLINCDFDAHSKFCEIAAINFSMALMNFDPVAKTVSFRKKSN